jgi:hypothetical protein
VDAIEVMAARTKHHNNKKEGEAGIHECGEIMLVGCCGRGFDNIERMFKAAGRCHPYISSPSGGRAGAGYCL